jgi:RNA polymerase sigma-70 factor (ECF subfamily)
MDSLTADLLRARAGDRLAFAAVVRRTQGEVWRLCAHLGGRDTADDLTQETYVRAYRALPAFRHEASVRTWLLSIARRACADEVRARTRRRRRDVRIAPPVDPPDPAAAVDLELLLSELDVDQRAAFVLTQLHGLSYAGAAAVCAVPVGTIRSRVARARVLLVDRVRAADAM